MSDISPNHSYQRYFYRDIYINKKISLMPVSKRTIAISVEKFHEICQNIDGHPAILQNFKRLVFGENSFDIWLGKTLKCQADV